MKTAERLQSHVTRPSVTTVERRQGIINKVLYTFIVHIQLIQKRLSFANLKLQTLNSKRAKHSGSII
jgi:hypothetical protein